MADQRVEKWVRWITGAIESDVLNMHLHRHTWRRLGEIIDEHGSLPDSYFWEYLRDTYAATQAVAVRRQADRHRDSASLGKLLAEIAGEPESITHSFWLGLWTKPQDAVRQELQRAEAERQWRDSFGGGDHLDPAIPARDVERLQEASAGVKKYVDENVAHSNKSPAAVEVTFNDMDKAIDTIGGIFRRYAGLLTASGWPSLVPTIQGYDWEAIFREPWISTPAEGDWPSEVRR